MERNSWVRTLVILAVIAVGLYVAGELWTLVVHFGDIIIEFFLAWLLAFILLPVVRFLDDHLPGGLPSAAAIVYLFLLVVLATILVLVVPLLLAQVSELALQLPTVAASAPKLIREVQAALDQRNIPIDLGTLTGPSLSQQAGLLGSQLVANTVNIASGVASGLFGFTLILILSFYFVVDGDRIVEAMLSMVPDHYAADARLFVVSIDRTFGGFLRGTAIQAAILGIGTGAIMAVAGLSYVLLASIFAAVVMVIPFIGPLLAIVLPILIGLFSNMPATQLLLYLVALVALQVLVMNIIAPKVMAETVGLHPLLVFLALLVGIKQAGIAGAIFGVPIAAVIVATIRIFLNRWKVIPGEPEQASEKVSPNGTVSAPRLRSRDLRLHLSEMVARLFHSKVG
ncbi:MAG TPA: AI-2E family transporter [Chloroflexota bacterium]|nr:AI-2E family transporter [Chloroflexota bacterium]